MLRFYQIISGRITAFLSTHEKGLFTTGARLLAVGCVILAIALVFNFINRLS